MLGELASPLFLATKGGYGKNFVLQHEVPTFTRPESKYLGCAGCAVSVAPTQGCCCSKKATVAKMQTHQHG